MRDYTDFDLYLNRLQADIYPQPADVLQQEYGEQVISNWGSQLIGCKTVLDVGCGEGQFSDAFARIGIAWTGVTLGPDYITCKNKGLNVFSYDFSFLHEIPDKSYDLIFARHSLEHSPFPLITLMEWRRVCKQWVCVILPVPEFHSMRGKNHYSVMPTEQFLWLANRAGLKLIWQEQNNFEYRFMLERNREVSE